MLKTMAFTSALLMIFRNDHWFSVALFELKLKDNNHNSCYSDAMNTQLVDSIFQLIHALPDGDFRSGRLCQRHLLEEKLFLIQLSQRLQTL